MRFLTKTVTNRLISQYAYNLHMAFQLESVVCGHHVYKYVCKPRIGEVSPGYQEHNNRDGVCLKKDSVIFRQVPRRFSRIVVLSKEDWRH